jgi:hypothetical protein
VGPRCEVNVADLTLLHDAVIIAGVITAWMRCEEYFQYSVCKDLEGAIPGGSAGETWGKTMRTHNPET